MSIEEVKGDLFTCPESWSLAHCISEDCVMGKGIAVLFKKKFGGVDDLKSQRKRTGEVATLKRGDERYIYYLITKARYFDKPTYDSVRRSLMAMRDHCIEHRVSQLAMPQIGCGLDRLQWQRVRDILHEVFKETGVHITIYSL